MDELREELLESQAVCEQLRMGQQGDRTTDKGNSLFSEVEDRRHLVERQMRAMRAKMESFQSKMEVQRMQLRKVRQDNLQLLAQTTTRCDRAREARLEELLGVEKARSRGLADRLDKLEKLQKTACSLPGGPSDEYAYLNAMLDMEKRKYEELQKMLKVSIENFVGTTIVKEYSSYLSMKDCLHVLFSHPPKLLISSPLQTQTMQNLFESDRMLELTRKVGSLEFEVSRGKAENYRLKMKLEEATVSGEEGETARKKAAAAAKKRAQGRFEMLVFDDEDAKKENGDPNTLLPPPEIVLHSAEDDKSKEEQGPTTSSAGSKKSKKTVSISSYVEDEEGKQTAVKEEGGAKSPAASSRPKRLANKKYNEVVYAAEEEKKWEEQCKQQ